MRDIHFRLLTFGRLTLVGGSGEEDASLSKQRRKLAVLAVLAMARRPIARDTLVEMFWGDQDEARARHSLSNALSCLRRRLGPKAISTRDAEVALTSDALLSVDALELGDAVEAREFGRAAELYAGPFLDGHFSDTSATFEHWVARERRRLEALFLSACAAECAMLARGRRWGECHTVASRWLDAEPLSADAAIYLLNATKAPATRGALADSLEEYESLKARLKSEFDLPPEPSVRALAAGIREQLAACVADPITATAEQPAAPASVPSARPAPSAPAVARVEAPPPPRQSRSAFVSRGQRRVLWTGVIAAIATSLLALTVVVHGAGVPGDTTAIARKPVIAVLSVSPRTGDSALTWLVDGLPQMIAGKLAHNSAVDVVPPAQVRAVLARSGNSGRQPVSDETARDLARRIGATLEVHGTIVRDGGKLVLDLTVRDVNANKLVESVVLTRDDPLALADQAAARILGAANVSGSGLQFAGVETSSLEAYQHYIRSVEAGQAGRYTETKREIDAAVALDSGFIAAVRSRIGIAVSEKDTALTRRLRESVKRHANRATDFDRLQAEAEEAFNTGERERSEALARAMVRRYPRDPRSYQLAQAILGGHGELREAERLAIQALMLDSLTVGAGDGPCAPCSNYDSIIALLWQRSDFAGAADWARKWIRVQPDAASAWTALAWTYSYTQKPDSALLLMRRAMSLTGGDLWAKEQVARMLLVARRYEAADSAIRLIEAVTPKSPERYAGIADLRSILARERGQYRESSRIMRALAAASPNESGFAEMILADNMRSLGDYASASRRYESQSHPAGERVASLPIPSPSARGFCWAHALAADASSPTADTITLRAKADTLEAGCGRSFYARDWRLYHHVRGLIAARAGRYAEAERELKQAIWSRVEGWTRTTVELADAQAALGRPRDAIATLRTAYSTRLDAMGRYVPISEVDYRMARMFEQAKEPDSARVYRSYVRTAWSAADPEIRGRLDRAH